MYNLIGPIARYGILFDFYVSHINSKKALGWNSWNAYGCDVNEDKIMTAANEVVKLGLKDLGYEYVNSKKPTPLATLSIAMNIS